MIHRARRASLRPRWDWLDETGRRRAAGFLRAVDRAAFVATQSFLRRVLAHHTGRAPQALRLGRGGRGKPRLRGAPALAFNMAHGGEWVVVAVGRRRRLGIDVEPVRRRRHLDAVVAAAYALPAARTLAQLPASERPRAVVRWWVRAEACAKATGRGLTLPVGDAVPAGFRLAMVDLDPRHLAALAFDGRPARVRVVDGVEG